MKLTLFASVALFAASAALAQNSVTINQSGGAGNSASISQAGDGNRVTISQQGTTAADGTKPGNRVSLRAPKGTQTQINQQNDGPNVIELTQDGQATAVINQSSATDQNTVVTLPDAKPARPQLPATNRRRRRS